jgi:hypothetical protein
MATKKPAMDLAGAIEQVKQQYNENLGQAILLAKLILPFLFTPTRIISAVVEENSPRGAVGSNR